MVEKEYNNEDLIICPFCGYENEDSWEVQHSDDSHECGSCDKKFILEVEHITKYSTKRMDCTDGHSMEFSLAWVKDSKYTETDQGYKDIELKESDWEFVESYECSECSEKDFKRITKEEFIEKYPDRYETTLTHFKNNMELKKLLDDVVVSGGDE